MKEDKMFISVILGLVSSLSQKYSIVILLVTFAIIFDVVTGLLKAINKGEKLSSKKCIKGFWSKIALVVALFFGVFLDIIIPYMLSFINITLPFNVPFGFIFGMYIILSESISIMENLFICNPKILPKWVSTLLLDAKEKIDNEKGND